MCVRCTAKCLIRTALRKIFHSICRNDIHQKKLQRSFCNLLQYEMRLYTMIIIMQISSFHQDKIPYY